MATDPKPTVQMHGYEAADKALQVAQYLVAELLAENDDSDYGLLTAAHDHIIAARSDLDADLK